MNFEQLLLTQAFQIAVLAAVVWLLTSFINRAHSHLAFALWLVVLIKCVTPPLWSSPASVFSWLESAEVAVSVPTVPLNESPEDATVFGNTVAEMSAEPIALPPLSSNSMGNLPAAAEEIVEASSSPGPLETFGQPQQHGGRYFERGLPIAWLSAAGLLLVTTIIRATIYVCRLSASTTEASQLQHRVDGLSKRLNIKRKIRVRETALPVGPAVMGLFRPKIVLPHLLTERFSEEELNPILAHELIHIRRGDLWIGLLRHVACSLWWFHPLVWKAGSAVRRGAEDCCDEEVISSLGISASDYARSLLNVLELKQELKVIPVAPGVRPFDITARRLEKIMKCGIHSRTRTPIWCWVIAVLLGIATLPGAGLMIGEETESTTSGAGRRAGSRGFTMVDL